MVRRRSSSHEYARTARVNELLREILGDEITRLDDDRLGFVSVTGVEVDTELTLAKVYVSTLDDDPSAAIEALHDHRNGLKSAIARQARLRRTPQLVFSADAGVATGGRIEEILAALAEEHAADEGSEVPEPGHPDEDA